MQAFVHERYWARTSDPSLSIWGSRSRPFAQVRSTARLRRIHPATERLNERERTLILAILATRLQPFALVLTSKYALGSAERLFDRRSIQRE
jgi:hypothetical protein